MGSASSFRLNTLYVVVGGLPAPYVPGIDQPEGMVPLWFDWGWFHQAVVASSSSWGVVVTALTSTRCRTRLLDVGVAAPVGRVVGGAVGLAYSSSWWPWTVVAH